MVGMVPFLIGDAVKASVALILARSTARFWTVN